MSVIAFTLVAQSAMAQTTSQPPEARRDCVSATPAPIEAWCFIVEKAHPVAMASSGKNDVGEGLVGIRIECGPGGRLEYVPIALRLFKPWKDFWLQGVDDNEFTIPLVNRRVTGADNVLLSKQFLATEAI